MEQLTKIEEFEDWLEKYPRLERVYWFLCRHCSNIKYGIRDFYYRVRWGYVPSEVWDFHSFAIERLLPNLRRFVKSDRMGCPGDLWDGCPEWKGKECHKWDEILEEILWSFEWYKKYEIDCDWDELPNDYNEQSKRAAAGFELFGKYLLGMWD